MRVCPDCQQAIKSWELFCPKCSRDMTGDNRFSGANNTKK